jgi:tetratricopeptide (TPR) repeat protein
MLGAKLGRYRPTASFLCAGTAYLAAGRIDEAAAHTREALALARRLGDGGNEAHALCLNGDIAAASGAENTEDYYRQALALEEPRGMRPLVAHCHLGLGKMHHRMGDPGQAQEHLATAMAMYREMGMTYWLELAETEMRQRG